MQLSPESKNGHAKTQIFVLLLHYIYLKQEESHTVNDLFAAATDHHNNQVDSSRICIADISIFHAPIKHSIGINNNKKMELFSKSR